MTDSDEPDDGNGDVPRGPKVAPGTFTVELQADGRKIATETLTVAKDPRSPATPADFEQQFNTSYKIFADSLESRRALAETGSVKEQLGNEIAKEIIGKADIQKQVATLVFAIDALLSGQSSAGEKQIGLDEANTALTAALHVSESSDRSIPAQALELYAQAHAATTARVEQWAALKTGPLAELNRQLKTQSLTPITIAEIERLVDYLMTR